MQYYLFWFEFDKKKQILFRSVNATLAQRQQLKKKICDI